MEDAMTKTREQELAEQFKTGLDPESATAMATRVADLEAKSAEWDAQRDSLLNDTAAALAARDAAEARADVAERKAKATVARAPAEAKPRAVKAMDSKLSGDELKAAIAAADKVEIAFSDGKRELAGTQPVVVSGEVWRDHTLGLMLAQPVTLNGASAGGSSISVDGYGLLLDGKQVGYCKRSDPLTVAPGQTVNIADDIYF